MFQCKLKAEKKTQPAVLEVRGEATIQHCQEFKDALVAGLKEHPDLVVDCSKVTEVDISCLQLLCAAHRTYQAMKLTLESLSSLKAVVEPSGFDRTEGCSFAADKKSCLWICESPAA